MSNKNESWLWLLLTLLIVTVIGHTDKQVERKFRRIAMVVTAILILLPLGAAYYANLPPKPDTELNLPSKPDTELPATVEGAETAEVSSSKKNEGPNWRWELTWGGKKLAESAPAASQTDPTLEEARQNLQEAKQNLEQAKEEVAAIESETKSAWQRFKDRFLKNE